MTKFEKVYIAIGYAVMAALLIEMHKKVKEFI